MIELYHFGFSTCSQKVRLVLAEKGLEFTSREVNLIAGEQHDPAYVKLNPGHVVPTLVHDGRVFIESTLLLRYLEDAFPEPALRSSEPAERYREDRWLQRIDHPLHTAAPVLTYALGPRAAVLAKPEAEREAHLAAIPDPAARAARRSVIEHGVRAPEFVDALEVFVATLDALDADLAERSWLGGERPNLADASALPYMLRVEHLAMDPLIAARPQVADWLARWKARDTYATAVDAWVPAPAVELMRSQGEAAWPEIEAMTARREDA